MALKRSVTVTVGSCAPRRGPGGVCAQEVLARGRGGGSFLKPEFSLPDGGCNCRDAWRQEHRGTFLDQSLGGWSQAWGSGLSAWGPLGSVPKEACSFLIFEARRKFLSCPLPGVWGNHSG